MTNDPTITYPTITSEDPMNNRLTRTDIEPGSPGSHDSRRTPISRCGGVFSIALAAAISLALGCGGGNKGAKNPGDGTLPGGDVIGEGTNVGKKPERTISRDTKRDYQEALAYFQKQESEGWNKSNCESAADKFASVASDHPKLVEAPYMSALAYHRCNLSDKAEKAYRQALKVDGRHALSMSNLGALYFQDGKLDQAKQQWEGALKVDGKIVGARNNLAWLLLQELRGQKAWSSSWKRTEQDARDQLSASLAVDTENVRTYVLYALVYMEGWERNKSRLDLAKLLLDEGAERNDKFAPLYNARGLLQMNRNNQGEALKNFQQAVELDPDFVEARMNVGNITLGFRKYDTAEEQFTKVLALQPNDYDAVIGLGVAQRGLGKLDDAEASYKKAVKLDSNRGAAHFNLGVLYKDFRANSSDDLKASQAAYREAREYFQTFMSKPDAASEDKQEAKDNISDCDKIIKQLDDVIKAMAQDAASK